MKLSTLPTAEETFSQFAKAYGYQTWTDMRNAFVMDGFALNDRIFKAVESHTQAHTENLKEQIQAYKECFELFIPEDKWDEATAFLSSFGSRLAKEIQRKEK